MCARWLSGGYECTAVAVGGRCAGSQTGARRTFVGTHRNVNWVDLLITAAFPRKCPICKYPSTTDGPLTNSQESAASSRAAQSTQPPSAVSGRVSGSTLMDRPRRRRAAVLPISFPSRYRSRWQYSSQHILNSAIRPSSFDAPSATTSPDRRRARPPYPPPQHTKCRSAAPLTGSTPPPVSVFS